MNLPNILTTARIVLALPFLLCLFIPTPAGQFFALLLFFAASATDYFDGKIARARNLKTRYGALMDPIADKVLTLGAFFAFALLGVWPGIAVALIALREIGITFLRLHWVKQGRGVIEARRLGKLKTALQMTAILLAILSMLFETGVFGLSFAQTILWSGRLWFATTAVFYAAFFVTIYSGLEIIFKSLRAGEAGVQKS